MSRHFSWAEVLECQLWACLWVSKGMKWHPPAPAPSTLATPPKTTTQSCSGSGTAKVGSRKKAAGKAITSVGSLGDRGAIHFSNSGRSNAQSSLHPQTGDSLWVSVPPYVGSSRAVARQARNSWMPSSCEANPHTGSSWVSSALTICFLGVPLGAPSDPMGPGDGKPSIKASMSSANPSSAAKAHNWLWMSASGHSWQATENLEGDSSAGSRTSAAAPTAASPQSRTGSNSLVAGVPLGAPGTISAMAFLALEQRVEARVTWAKRTKVKASQGKHKWVRLHVSILHFMWAPNLADSTFPPLLHMQCWDPC